MRWIGLCLCFFLGSCQTIQSAHLHGHYYQKGIASWYGKKFHAKPTSSGERYDMYGLSAAHRTLPLGSYIRVKNLSNGRTVVVKVNDRGPFHSQRILDVSYGAAVKLGFFPKGTAMVEVQTLRSRK